MKRYLLMLAVVFLATAKGEEFIPQFSDPVPEPPATAKGPRILLVGGGASHDFKKWYGEKDVETLRALNPGWLEYTQNANGVGAILERVDVLAWSANQPVSSQTRAALSEFANSDKGLVVLHPGNWYAWKNFPEWNRRVLGGGAKGHDRLGEFEVEVLEPKHPLMAGLPARFKIVDELYHVVPDPAEVPITVLAQATSPLTGKVFPQVWIPKNPKARVVCITFGHDERAHESKEYQTLLKNAFRWAAGRGQE